MHTCHRNAFWLACFGVLAFSSFGQEPASQLPGIKVELARTRDLKLTARRMRISVEQLTNARAALKEATDLAMRQDPPMSNDYSTMARLWMTLNRKEARTKIASMIQRLCSEAQSAEDLVSYRKYTAPAFQMLTMLVDIDAEKAKQIADLWPEPASKISEPGRQALAQFQNDFNTRYATLSSTVMDDQKLDQYLQSQKSSSLQFSPRLAMATSLVSANQKEKARQILDQAIADLGKRDPDPGKNGDIEGFLRGLASFYPERFMDAFEIYQGLLSRQDPATVPGVIYQLGDDKILLSQSESVAVGMMRGMYGKPELTLKLLESQPGLRAKFERVGGIDSVLSPPAISSSVSATPMIRFYPANAPPPAPPVAVPGTSPARGADFPSPEKLVSPSELLRTLRGKAETNPEAVRRKLMDTCQKKEHFPVLISLAQSASYQDSELSLIALEVAHSLLPFFDNLQQRASSLRTLITTSRQIEGEVEATLLSEGYIIVREMREDEKGREPAASQPPAGAMVFHPSDEMEIFLLTQNALDDFRAALSRIHSISEEAIRIKALLQIAQALSNNY